MPALKLNRITRSRLAHPIFAIAGIAVLGGIAFVLFKALDAVHIQFTPPVAQAAPYAAAIKTFVIPADKIQGSKTNSGAREIAFDIWYPTTKKAGTNTTEARTLTWNPFRQPKAKPLRDAPPILNKKRMPVLVYMPGWGGPRGDNTFLISWLVANGYVVIELDDIGFDPYQQVVARRPTDQAARHVVDLSTKSTATLTLRAAERRLELMQDKVARVVAYLVGNTAVLARKLKGLELFDFTRMGALGFSFGGSVAASLPDYDKRFVAIINMDGWLTGKTLQHGISVANLTFNSDFPNLKQSASHSNYTKRMYAILTIADRKAQYKQLKRPASYSWLFRHIQHYEFTDSLFFPSLRAYLKRRLRGAMPPQKIRAILDHNVKAFFDHHLFGQAKAASFSIDSASHRDIRSLHPTLSSAN